MDSITMLDGAMGTLLLRQGIARSIPLEGLCLTDPQRITAIHHAYLTAGAQILYANTMGVNRLCLEHPECDAAHLIHAAVNCAKAASAGTNARIAVSSGPCGTIPPAIRSAACEAIVRAAEAAGADLLVFETMIDKTEALCALNIAKKHTALPVFVTLTCDASGRMPCGAYADQTVSALEQAGSDAVGLNCSLGPDRMLAVMESLAKRTALPLVLKLSAGLPDPQTGEYPLSPEAYAHAVAPYLPLGISYLGGCCGTTPEYIKALAFSYIINSVKE